MTVAYETERNSDTIDNGSSDFGAVATASINNCRGSSRLFLWQCAQGARSPPPLPSLHLLPRSLRRLEPRRARRQHRDCVPLHARGVRGCCGDGVLRKIPSACRRIQLPLVPFLHHPARFNDRKGQRGRRLPRGSDGGMSAPCHRRVLRRGLWRRRGRIFNLDEGHVRGLARLVRLVHPPFTWAGYSTPLIACLAAALVKSGG